MVRDAYCGLLDRGSDQVSDAERSAAETRYREDLGCGRQDAALGARAQFPFDDAAVPTDGLRKDISRRVSHLVSDIEGLRGSAVGVAARHAIEQYFDLARDHRDMYHVDVFEDILETSRGPAGPPEPGE